MGARKIARPEESKEGCRFYISERFQNGIYQYHWVLVDSMGVRIAASANWHCSLKNLRASLRRIHYSLHQKTQPYIWEEGIYVGPDTHFWKYRTSRNKQLIFCGRGDDDYPAFFKRIFTTELVESEFVLS